MALLPRSMRFRLFDRLSVKTMRYVHAVPRQSATGLVAEVYRQIEEDFFINGSLTSRSGVPPILAGIWMAGRETILVEDQLDRTTKEALAASLSAINACPYCGDMLVSLVAAGDRADAAADIFTGNEHDTRDPVMRERLAWVRQTVLPDGALPNAPFTPAQYPEALGSLLIMADINRFSHVVMNGSPVKAPLGSTRLKQLALRMFGSELKVIHTDLLRPGRALPLLPESELPQDLQWAESNARVAEALAKWAKVVDDEAKKVIPADVSSHIHDDLSRWQGERMPLSLSWLNDEVTGFTGKARSIAKLALLVAKSPWQVTESLAEQVLREQDDERDFVRILSWCAATGARYTAARIAAISPPILEDSDAAA